MDETDPQHPLQRLRNADPLAALGKIQADAGLRPGMVGGGYDSVKHALEQEKLNRFAQQTQAGILVPLGYESPEQKGSKKQLTDEEIEHRRKLKEVQNRFTAKIERLLARVMVEILPEALVYLMSITEPKHKQRQSRLYSDLRVSLKQGSTPVVDTEGEVLGNAQIFEIWHLSSNPRKFPHQMIGDVKAIPTKEGKVNFTSKVLDSAEQIAITHPIIRRFIKEMALFYPLAKKLFDCMDNDAELQAVCRPYKELYLLPLEKQPAKEQELSSGEAKPSQEPSVPEKPPISQICDNAPQVCESCEQPFSGDKNDLCPECAAKYTGEK